MTQRHRTLAAGLLGLALSAPGVALAHDGWEHHDRDDHHDRWEAYRLANLSIQNTFDGEVDVRVDGQWIGRVAGDAVESLQVAPGVHDIQVVRPSTGFVLVATRLQLFGGSTTSVPVTAPRGALRVTNAGEVALRVQADGGSVWIAPGTTGQLPVETGTVAVVASIKEPRGEWRAMERSVWVEPGRVGAETLRPDPTVIVVTNRDHVPVRALVDGVDAGLVGGDSTRRIWVHPGSTAVVLLGLDGRVRTSTTLYVARGREARVVVEPRWPVVSAVVTVGGERPPGPVPAHYPTDGCDHH